MKNIKSNLAPAVPSEDLPPALLYRASDSLMNALVWLDTHAPDWVRADIKGARAELRAALDQQGAL